MIKALLFDFDGLIIDTETPEVAAWKAIYAEQGFDYPVELWSQTIGGWGEAAFDPGAELSQKAGPAIDLPAIRRRQRQHADGMILNEPLRPGVMSYLSEARRLGLRLAIASSSDREWVEPHLIRLGIRPLFEKIVTGDDVPPRHTKPFPDIFMKALSELQIQPNEAVAIEDSPNGVLAAKAAGLFVVMVPNTTTAQLPRQAADIELKSLAELPLPDLLQRAKK